MKKGEKNEIVKSIYRKEENILLLALPSSTSTIAASILKCIDVVLGTDPARKELYGYPSGTEGCENEYGEKVGHLFGL